MKCVPGMPLKRQTKRVAWALLAAAGAGFLVLAATLTGLNHTPYFTTEYYATTMDRLDAAGSAVHEAHGLLRAGFGKSPLTPEIHLVTEDPRHGRFKALPLAGYGARKGRPATGIHDALWAKAVAFRTADHLGLMIGADTLIVPREVADLVVGRLREELKLNRDQIYFGATHTHAGPGGWGDGMVAEAFAGPFQPGVREWLAAQLTRAARNAVADLRPATIGHGRFAAPQWVRNRLVGDKGMVDDAFNYILVKQADGDQAVIGSYAAHATVLPADFTEFSADYPGVWQRSVEEQTGGMALFLAGAVGSHGPVAGAPGFAGANRMGRGLAEALLRCLPETVMTNRVTLATAAVVVELPELQVRVSDGVRLRPWVARRILPFHRSAIIQMFRVNDAVWISTPCDFSGELAVGIRDRMRAGGWQAAVTSFNGDYIGYVVPSKYYHLNRYESRAMSFFGPNASDYLEEIIRRLAVSVRQPGARSNSARPLDRPRQMTE